MSSPSATEATTNTPAEAAQTSAAPAPAVATAADSSASNEVPTSEVLVEGILPASHWVAQEAPDVSPFIVWHDVFGVR